jgi:CheY-like chemotaxis protein
MSCILLADDSPHAQRMGEFILRGEGYEVVTVTDGETAVVRLADADPDLVLADVSLPGRNGYELCRFIKNHPKHRHAKVVLTAGALEPLNEELALEVQADGNLRKPFESSAVLNAVKPLAEAARLARRTAPIAEPSPDAERVRAAVSLALDAALPSMIDELTKRVLVALKR